MRQEVLEKYEILEDRPVSDLDSRGYYMKHKKSGARVLVLSNEDDNKVFCIGFRTPVSDSTGVPHILEHSVLCGSERFPGKDPFVELVKGSLNTFLNAMTYSDKTVYPVASCNDTDFQNLMHVYMDAVFCPNIYKKEEIFRQEGWHYELEEPDGDLIYNGVVYNEMKGAFSSAEGVLDRVILNSLFPDTCYANESGGDPEVIPTLKYSDFLDFHRRYYQPANSYIYLYGNMDVEEKLLWMDREYLCRYDALEIDSEIPLQKPFGKTAEVVKTYSISPGEEEKDHTYLSYNKVIGTSLDKKLYLAFEILEYALLGASGAPLKQALLDAGIGKDISSSYDNGIRQPIFSVIARNANPEDKERFVQVIEAELRRLVKEGLDRKALKAGINYYEFRYREADFGPYPKGLMYGLQAFDSWLYDDAQPFMHLEALDTFAFLRKQVDTGYYEQLIQTYLLDNLHASIVIIRPEKGLTAKTEAETAEKLKTYKESLSREQREALVRNTKALKAYQEEPSTKEDLEAIPVLQISDIRKTIEKIPLEEYMCGRTKVLHTPLSTNGIGYLQLDFDTRQVPDRLLPYLGLLPGVLGYVDTEHYSYQELFHEINILTGGIAASLSIYGNAKQHKDYTAALSIRAKVLEEQLDDAFRLIGEILFTSRFKDEKRIREILAKQKAGLQESLVSSGHSAASMRAMAYTSPLAAFSDRTSGIGFYATVEQLERAYEEHKEEIMENLQELMTYIFRPENLLVHYTSGKNGIIRLKELLSDFTVGLFEEERKEAPYQLTVRKCNEGFRTASKVQYVASAGNFIDAGFSYTGVLRILKVLLSYDYLWINIRVKGGAYGCMSGFSRIGDSYLVTYRDPNLGVSKAVFEGTPAYLQQFQADEQTMRKYIIGTISDLDTPLNPAAKGRKALSMYRNQVTEEDLQRERDEILQASPEDIRALAPLVQAVLSQNNFCVIGGEEKIEADQELFMEIKNLFQD